MKITRIIALAAFLFVCNLASAQKEQTILGSRGLRFSGVWGGSKSLITNFGNSNGYMNGGFFGLEFGKALTVGWSTYSLTNDIKWDNVSNQDFNFKFSGLTLGYGINNYKPIHGIVNVVAGNGQVWFNENEKDRVFVIQPSAGVEFNIFRWFHIGVEGGYRFVSDSSTAGLTDSSLSSAMGQVTLKFGYSWGSGRKKAKSTTTSDPKNIGNKKL